MIIGASSTCSLKASKTLILKKTVYHLGNIDSVYSTKDIEEYIRSLGVHLISCFELKHADRQPMDNKAFRVCVIAADKDKLCDTNNWSVGVSLREWFHKPKGTGGLGPSAAAVVIGNTDIDTSIVQMNETMIDDSTNVHPSSNDANNLNVLNG
jgi:hypothetical protein